MYLDQMPDVMTAKELAKVLNLGYARTLSLLKSGTIPSICIGRNFRISKEQVKRWLNNQ